MSDFESSAGSGDDVDDEAFDTDPTGIGALLSSLPDPGPMPPEVTDRILAALTAEHAVPDRADDLADDLADEADEPDEEDDAQGLADALGLAAVRTDPDDPDADDPTADDWAEADDADRTTGTVVPLSAPERHMPRWLAIGAAAASVAAIAIGGTIIQDRREDAAVAVTGNAVVSQSAGAPETRSGQQVHIQLSTRAYTSGDLVEQAQDLLDRPGPTIGANAPETPTVGPIGTRTGLRTCVEMLGEGAAERVVADIATFDGQPVAVIVTVKGATKQVYVVQRSCTKGDPAIVTGPVALP